MGEAVEQGAHGGGQAEYQQQADGRQFEQDLVDLIDNRIFLNTKAHRGKAQQQAEYHRQTGNHTHTRPVQLLRQHQLDQSAQNGLRRYCQPVEQVKCKYHRQKRNEARQKGFAYGFQHLSLSVKGGRTRLAYSRRASGVCWRGTLDLQVVQESQDTHRNEVECDNITQQAGHEENQNSRCQRDCRLYIDHL